MSTNSALFLISIWGEGCSLANPHQPDEHLILVQLYAVICHNSQSLFSIMLQ